MLNASNIISLCWLIFLGYWIINWKSVKPAKEVAWRAPGFRWTLLWIIVLIILLTHFLFPGNKIHFFSSIVAPSPIFQIIGIVLTVLGVVIAIVARNTLSDNWSSDIELKKNHELITKGIYQYARHPIYTGLTFMGLGSVIGLQTLYVTFFFIAMEIFLIFKMKKEEKLLLKHFPKEYPAYMKKSKALIPFIY
jgi:protein-S-isoprenylcysteine O-methyltransferase Ste14